MDFHAVLIERGRCRIGTKTDVHMDLIAAASGFLDLPARAAAWLILMPSAAPTSLLCSGTQVTQASSDFCAWACCSVVLVPVHLLDRSADFGGPFSLSLSGSPASTPLISSATFSVLSHEQMKQSCALGFRDTRTRTHTRPMVRVF